MNILHEIEHVAKQLPGESLESVMAGFTAYGSYADYNELLDDYYGEIEICGLKYNAAYAFQAIDPIAYRCGYLDYLSNISNEGYVENNGLAYREKDLEEWLEQHEELRSRGDNNAELF